DGWGRLRSLRRLGHRRPRTPGCPGRHLLRDPSPQPPVRRRPLRAGTGRRAVRALGRPRRPRRARPVGRTVPLAPTIQNRRARAPRPADRL
ncbi:MAG: hypothetical protein AVDCRST_MAG88-3627, partial [uncultured Thermomicrobiales bacterium]